MAAAVGLVIAAAGYGGREGGSVTIYLKQRLGAKGPPGQVAPVLMPVQRERRRRLSPAFRVLDALGRGPTAGERARGFLSTWHVGTKWLGASVHEHTATVNLTGAEPDFYASAAIVYSLTALRGVHAVRLRLEGKACCIYNMRGQPIRLLTRHTFRGWQGEPCPLRTYRDAVRCRGR